MSLHRVTVVVLIVISSGYVYDKATAAPPAAPATGRSLIVVKGADGESQFGQQFVEAGQLWCQLAESQQFQLVRIGWESLPAVPDRSRLQQAIEEFAHSGSQEDLWIVLLGHGTFGSNTAKFNLVGPDVSAKELSDWIKPLNNRCVLVNCFSSSGPFITSLSGSNRIVLTATKSGAELNFTRFGKYLAESLQDLSADVDHDQEVSLLEAFLTATSKTERFYQEASRLATEHALLDDNGDRIGTSGDFFRGTRPAKAAEAGKQLDGRVAARLILYSSPNAPQLTVEQKLQRDALEQHLDALRGRKSELAAKAYEDQLEKLLLELARLYPEG
jgi:hypothetical protein